MLMAGDMGVSGLITGKAVRTVVDLSTTGVPTTIELSGALAQHDVLLIDAPVSGGVAGARDERLALMVACPTPVFAEIDTHCLNHLDKFRSRELLQCGRCAERFLKI